MVRHFTAFSALILLGTISLGTAAFAQTNQNGDLMEGQIRFGFDALDYNVGRTSQVGSIDATIRLTPRLTIEAVANGGTYFGERFGGGGGYVTFKPGAQTYLTIGGLRNSETSTTLAWAASLEAGHAIYRSEQGAIRGLETDFDLAQRNYHLAPSTGVMLLDPRIVVYLPRDWTLTVHGGAIRTNIAGLSDWTPSGSVSLKVPVTHRLSVSPAFAFDSESADVLQLQNLSSRQFGGAANLWLTHRTSVGAYYFRVFYGANHLTANSYGISYALRF